MLSVAWYAPPLGCGRLSYGVHAIQSAYTTCREFCSSTPEYIEGASSVPIIDGEEAVCSADAQNPAIAAKGHALHDAYPGKLLCWFTCKVNTSFLTTEDLSHEDILPVMNGEDAVCNADARLLPMLMKAMHFITPVFCKVLCC